MTTLVRAHRLAALADELRGVGFYTVAHAVEQIPAAGAVRRLVVPTQMWRALAKSAPALARALRGELTDRGILVETKSVRPGVALK